MMTQPLPNAGKLPIKALVAKQLPWQQTCMHVDIVHWYGCVCLLNTHLTYNSCSVETAVLYNNYIKRVLSLISDAQGYMYMYICW